MISPTPPPTRCTTVTAVPVSAVASPFERPLRKPVFALGLKPRANKITLMSRKIWNVLLYKSQHERGLAKEVYRCPLSEIIAGLDFNSNDHALVKYHLRSLASTTVEWESPTAGESASWTVCALISHATLKKERGVIWVEWSLPPNMREQLLDPDIYAQIHLRVAAQMSSHAGLALYEICSRYRDVRTARNPWQWWVPVLTGRVDDERLQKMEYRHFKRDVLRPAIAEINAISEMNVQLVEHKQGRFIHEIQFTIEKKSQRSLDMGVKPEPVDMSLLAAGERLGVDHTRLEQLVATYGEDAVRVGIEATARRAATAFPEPLRDAWRYLKSTMPGHAQAVEQGRAVEREVEGPQAVAAAADERRSQWERKWVAMRHAQVLGEIKALDPQRQAELTAALAQEMERIGQHPALRKTLTERGWWHHMVRAKMLQFYAAGAYGADWDKPTDADLLQVAAQDG